MRIRGGGLGAALLVGVGCVAEPLGTAPDGAAGVGGIGGGPPLMGMGGGGGGGAGGVVPCEAPTILCGGTCVDPASSAEHCGECGYTCGTGSSCSKGECSAVAVVSDVFAPYALVADAANLYWTAPVTDPNGAPLALVYKAARGGEVAASVFSVQTGRSRALALSESILYFSKLDSVGGILKGDVRGYTPEMHVIGQVGVQHIAVADDELVWSTFDGTASRVRRSAARGAVAAGDVVELVASAQAGLASWVLAEKKESQVTAYWAGRAASQTVPTDLWRRGPLEGVPTRIASVGTLGQFALAGEGIYLAAGAVGLVRVNKSGAADQPRSTVVEGVDAGDTILGLTATADRLYWLTFEAMGLVLHRAGLDGSGARVLGRVPVKNGATYLTQSLKPAYVVVADDDVYFADQGTLTGDIEAASNPRLEGVKSQPNGTIYRLPK
jgi:Stigma-specific protein, Stig1